MVYERLQEFYSIIAIDLSRNKISAEIPKVIGDLKNKWNESLLPYPYQELKEHQCNAMNNKKKMQEKTRCMEEKNNARKKELSKHTQSTLRE